MKTNKITVTLCLIFTLVVFTLNGCGGGGNTAATTVSGVAASGAPMTGTVYLKDSANNPEMSTTINAQNGTFSFDVSGRTGPFMLRAGTLYSMVSGPGTANINPLTHLMVADAGGFTDMASMNTFYNSPSSTTMGTISGNIGTARQHMQQKMAALLTVYGVASLDPITVVVTIGQGMDRMFDDVKMIIDPSGVVTMMYANGTMLYTGPMSNMSTGTMMSGNIVTPPATPSVSGVVITPSLVKMQMNLVSPPQQQFAANIPVTWSMVTTNSGTIDANSGLYTGPNVQGMFLVKATSIADATKSSVATVLMGSGGMMM